MTVFKDRFEFGLDVIIAGMVALSSTRRRRTPPRHRTLGYSRPFRSVAALPKFLLRDAVSDLGSRHRPAERNTGAARLGRESGASFEDGRRG